MSNKILIKNNVHLNRKNIFRKMKLKIEKKNENDTIIGFYHG